jgi:hypothetical protein
VAQATPAYSRFHNLSPEQLADAIGQADALLKGAEAECKALKDEFKSRGLLTASGEHFTVTRSDQVSSRLDTKAVKQFLGDAWRKFETASITAGHSYQIRRAPRERRVILTNQTDQCVGCLFGRLA